MWVKGKTIKKPTELGKQIRNHLWVYGFDSVVTESSKREMQRFHYVLRMYLCGQYLMRILPAQQRLDVDVIE